MVMSGAVEQPYAADAGPSNGRPADRCDGYCLIVFLEQIGLAIVYTVQFSTHCGQI
jgi:hypothetical protein